MGSKKFLCPRHQEQTPSVELYGKQAFCFGCRQIIPLSELGEGVEIAESRPVYVEDIAASINRIRALPKQEIRGFSLHADHLGYYLLWGDSSFYKRRVYGADATSKYRGPSGHKKPPFVVSEGKGDRLVLVEGEFNALSLGSLEPQLDIISPGGAGDFYSRSGVQSLGSYSRYSQCDIVCDADAAGAQAAIETKAKLVTLGCPDVRIHLVEKDFNQVLCDSGKEALREECKRLGLL